MTYILGLLLAFAIGGAFSTWIFLLVRLVRLEDVHAHDLDPFTSPAASVTSLPSK